MVAGDSLVSVEKNLFNQNLFNKLEQLKPLFFDESSSIKKADLKHQIDAILYQLTNAKQTFDFEIYFSEVFHRNHGFDVVIANPPYIQLSKVSSVPESYRQNLKSRFRTSGGRANTFIFFIHLAVEILKQRGCLAVIVPNTILTQEYYSATRELLLRLCKLRTVVQYSELPFENAVVENVTIIATKEKVSDYAMQVVMHDLKQIRQVAEKRSVAFLGNPKYAININSDEVIDKVFSRHRHTLAEYCEVNQAIALKGDRKVLTPELEPTRAFFQAS